MAATERVILTNMCMVRDENGQVLVIERADTKWGGIAFPGGHIEPGESLTAAVVREVREETGLTITDPTLCGMKQFWRVDTGERYLVFMYRATAWTGSLTESAEGHVFWTPRETLESLPLAENFIHMVRAMESPTPLELYYPPKSSPEEPYHLEIYG